MKNLKNEIKLLKIDISTAQKHLAHNERVEDLEGVAFWAAEIRSKTAALAVKEGNQG